MCKGLSNMTGIKRVLPDVGSSAPRSPDEVAIALSELIRRVASGDKRAFHRVYSVMMPKLYARALRILRQPSLAADATHEAFLQVWRNADRFDEARGHPEAWLISLLRYRALDILQSRRREAKMDEIPEPVDESLDGLGLLIKTQDVSILQMCLSQLEASRRRLLMLRFAEGLTHVEVAKQMQVPLGTAKSNIRRTLQSLRQCMDGGVCAVSDARFGLPIGLWDAALGCQPCT